MPRSVAHVRISTDHFTASLFPLPPAPKPISDSAYIFAGGLPFDLTEGDIITVFSQFGEIVDINVPRDRETGKARGFAFIQYEDQRSTVLAVDNMNGGKVLGRTIRVDHCRDYKQKGTKNEEGEYVQPEEPSLNAMPQMVRGDADGGEFFFAAEFFKGSWENTNSPGYIFTPAFTHKYADPAASVEPSARFGLGCFRRQGSR